MDPKKSKNSTPRIKVIQKLYNSLMNPEAKIDYPKSQYKKFIKDIEFKNLVLCIIDEEHRFGVKQKEKIKAKLEKKEKLKSQSKK